MASKFEELMKAYGSIKQFPMSGQLPPLSKEQQARAMVNYDSPEDLAMSKGEQVSQVSLHKGLSEPKKDPK